MSVLRVYTSFYSHCLGPADMAELARLLSTALPSNLWPRVPRDPPNLPNTKKLKYFNILCFFSWCQSLYPGCWGRTVFYIYIYIMCIYILYFFWLGLFLIKSYTMVASPSLKGCHILMLENELEGKADVSLRV